MTVRQAIDLDLWSRVCEYKDWSPCILSEGRIREGHVVEFDSKFRRYSVDNLLISIDQLVDWLELLEAGDDKTVKGEIEDILEQCLES